MAQIIVCKLGSKTGTICSICYSMRQKWTINIQANMEYSQRASKWKVVIKQAPSGLEEIRLLLLRFCCQHRMLFNSK